MKFGKKLEQASQKNNSLLCVGLDIDLSKTPKTILNQEDPIFVFNRSIIDKTKDLVCAYKPNIAFYEMYGDYGLASLIKTIEYIKTTEIPVILDAKRGDIGNSSASYAKTIFNVYKADATTVSPYMGYDSVAPFLEYEDKTTFILCLTSNKGSNDFQREGDKPLYKSVAKKVAEWNTAKNCGLVVGATNPEEIKELREIAPNLPFLIPGVGTQGGDAKLAVKYGADKNGTGAIINASRSIIYAQDPREAAKQLRDTLNNYRWAK